MFKFYCSSIHKFSRQILIIDYALFDTCNFDKTRFVQRRARNALFVHFARPGPVISQQKISKFKGFIVQNCANVDNESFKLYLAIRTYLRVRFVNLKHRGCTKDLL